jgi:hypothetical protein
MAKWIEFEERQAPSGYTTKRWHVIAKRGLVTLGTISWYSGWRRYCFYPHDGSSYEQDCLRDIADFCEQQTIAHRGKIKTSSAPGQSPR